MKTVELVPGIRSSVLGFGCGSIGGLVSHGDGAIAVREALSLGVNHFDLAPSYGYGTAEEFIGRLLAKERDNVVLATKFGITVRPIAKVIGPAKTIARPIFRAIRTIRARSSSNVKGGSGIGAGRMHWHVPITGVSLQTSFERSLRRLRTDHIDYLMLHSPTAPIIDFESVLKTACDLKSSGKLRAFGLAFYLEDLEIHNAYIHEFDFLQFQTPHKTAWIDPFVQSRFENANVLFAPITAMKLDGETDSQVYLSKINKRFPKSVILCSMSSSTHIRENVAALSAVQ